MTRHTHVARVTKRDEFLWKSWGVFMEGTVCETPGSSSSATETSSRRNRAEDEDGAESGEAIASEAIAGQFPHIEQLVRADVEAELGRDKWVKRAKVVPHIPSPYVRAGT